MAYPTPYPEVNAVLDILLARVKRILGDDFVGMYLGGSLALNDFIPGRSDIDFVVVTADVLSDETFVALKATHAQMNTEGVPMAKELEGAYVPVNDLRLHNPPIASYPHIDTGEALVIEKYEDWWVIERHVLREHGVVVAGPDPMTLVAPILPDELKQAAIRLFHYHWAAMLRETTKLHHPGYQVYAILTMCRILYSLNHGTIVSKSEAAVWARQTLPEHTHGLIERALEWRNGQPFDYLNETLGLIRYVQEHQQ
jgi:hypothetical protein